MFEHYEPDLLMVIGAIIAFAFLGSKIFQRLGIPQVVGFIVMGVVLGSSFLNFIPLEMVDQLSFISYIALGLIGFDMGGHLHFSELLKARKSLLFILVFEAVGTFLLVALGVYIITKSLQIALIFGALASATDPAATVEVMAEYDAKGPLTTSLLAIVGLDDALALLLYSIAAAAAENFLAGSVSQAHTLTEMVALPLIEVVGGVALGAGVALILDFILCRMKRKHDAMAISIASVLIVVGISISLGFSYILATMVLGAVTVNKCPEHGRHIRFTIEQAGPVIYVLFFALIGARFQISLLPTMGMLGITYVLLRSVGKFSGAWLGGKWGGAEPSVRNNLGFGLFSQAGVAIGLAMTTADRFSVYGESGIAFGSLIISVITATTFILQLIGPNFAKLAITRAGEIGKAKESQDDVWASEGSPI
jgi:NhaP-type Na+/H+ or K+/H+ antiporter